MGKLYIMDDIDTAAYKKFSEELAELEANKSVKVIEVDLLSDGGSAYVAMAFFDRIKSSRCAINITATGTASSAAILILAAGAIRRMTKNAWIMVHEDLASCNTTIEELRITEAEREIKHLRMLEDKWNALLESVTSCSAAGWKKLHQESQYLDANKCLRLGLIEEVV